MPRHYPDLCSTTSQGANPWTLQCRCLLASCGRLFSPCHRAQVFCGDGCRLEAREGARRVSLNRADKKYRLTEQGKEKRRAQSQRRRGRIKAQREAAGAECEACEAAMVATEPPRVGDTDRLPKKEFEKNLAAVGQAVAPPSLTIPECRMPSSVAFTAATTCARRSPE